MADVRLTGRYTPYQKLRDMCSIGMIVAQPLLWWKFGNIWSLVVPVILLGTLASYFTVKDRALFDFLWKNHARGMLHGLALITVPFAVACLYCYHFKYWFAVIIFLDCLYVYWVTMLGWLVRERLR